MFCPRCGRQQALDETRYCNGCGLLLSDVTEALENDGRIERSVVAAARELRRGAAKALALLTLSALFFLLSLILGTPEPSFFVQFNMAVGILCFLVGLVWIAHTVWKKTAGSRGRADEEKREQPLDVSQSLRGRHAESARSLNEADLSGVVGADVLRGGGLKTDELVERPPSVIEGTTRLLKEDL